MGPPRARLATSSTTTNAVLGYIAMTGSPEHSPSTASSLTYSSTATSTPGSTDAHGSTHHGMPPITSAGQALEHPHSAANLYALSSAAGSRRNSIDLNTTDASALVSGQHYTSLMQPQPRHMASFEGLRGDSVVTPRFTDTVNGGQSKHGRD